MHLRFSTSASGLMSDSTRGPMHTTSAAPADVPLATGANAASMASPGAAGAFGAGTGAGAGGAGAAGGSGPGTEAALSSGDRADEGDGGAGRGGGDGARMHPRRRTPGKHFGRKGSTAMGSCDLRRWHTHASDADACSDLNACGHL